MQAYTPQPTETANPSLNHHVIETPESTLGTNSTHQDINWKQKELPGLET